MITLTAIDQQTVTTDPRQAELDIESFAEVTQVELFPSGDPALDAWRKQMCRMANLGCCGTGGDFEL